MAKCQEGCKVCTRPATLDTVPQRSPEEPDVISVTGCECGSFTAEREWWYMEADLERAASPGERFTRLSSALRSRHNAGKPAHLTRKTWSELAPPTAPEPEKLPVKPRKRR